MKYLPKNAAHFRALRGLNQTQYGILLGTSQSSISRMENGSNKTEIDTVFALSKAEGHTIDALLSKDLTIPGAASSQSQSAQLDTDKLGHALTSIDKALANRKIRGRMGKMRKTLAFAYKMTDAFPNLATDDAQKEAYDLLVKSNLVGELDGQGTDGPFSGGQEGNSEFPAGKKTNRSGNGRGKNP